MPIKTIEEIKNASYPKIKVVKERMDKYIPGVTVPNIPNLNGFVYILSGSGGSGKSNLLFNMFQNKSMYRNNFDNIYYFCPISSFESIKKHPFKKHDKIYHSLSSSELETIYQELVEIKKTSEDIQYNCIIIDDFADALKDNDILMILNKMIIKARHLSCAFIITLQSYFYFPKQLRKQITNITIFKPKALSEWETISKELMNLNKEDGLKVFNYVFNEPYNHLDINTTNNTYYKNFNELKFLE